MRKILIIILLLCTYICEAANTKEATSQVVNSIELNKEVDYHISGTNPFSTTGSIDITNDDAVVIFDNIHPSEVRKNYLDRIFIKGEKAVNDQNAFITIWQNGAIVYPHKNQGFTPLTVFSGKNFEGESSSNYKPYTRYGALGNFKNNISSFKLKRGYMVCFATGSTGKGYSRVWIAQDEDVEVPDMGKYLSGKVGFIRIVAWKAVSKKGTANANVNMLQAQTTYDWGGGDDALSNSDYEYVGMHHHEGWTNWSTLANNSHEIHVLGNNEPDNSGDAKEQYIKREDIEKTLFSNGAWSESQTTGMRIGSPAPSGDIGGWLVDFMDLCRKYNQRIDFIALHIYWHSSGQSFSDRVNWVYDLFKRPVWITEWNYGANWTDESWPDGNRGAGKNNQAHALAGIKDIVTSLENNPHLERYLIYNWVEDCRSVILNDKLTPAGEWYAGLKSNMAYTGGEGYIPTWNYWAPQDLTVEYDKVNKQAKLKWKSYNDKQTDSIHIERKLKDMKEFEVIATMPMTEGPDYFFTDNVDGLSGYITYRITDFDSDSHQRKTGEAGITIGSSQGNSTIQFGTLTLSDTKSVSTDFNTEFESIPEVFMGISTTKNTKMTPCNFISTITKKNFTYQILPWQYSGEKTMTEKEDIPFMAIQTGNYTFGKIDVEVGNAKVKTETTEIKFTKPFPEGVVPVVIAETKPTLKNNPIMYRIWDVTNEGFKATIVYEEGSGQQIKLAQTLNYMACTPGSGAISDDIIMTAGFAQNPVYGSIIKPMYFVQTNTDGTISENADTLRFESPTIFGALQTYNVKTGAVIRKGREITIEDPQSGKTLQNGFYIRRYKDATSAEKDNKDTADKFGWICLSKADESTSIKSDKIIGRSENPIIPTVENRIVYLENNEKPFELFTINGIKVAENATQEPGVYVVKQGKKTAKVIIR